MQPKTRACELMSTCAVARNQRGALTQAGAGIAASRLASCSISRGHWCLQRRSFAHVSDIPRGPSCLEPVSSACSARWHWHSRCRLRDAAVHCRHQIQPRPLPGSNRRRRRHGHQRVGSAARPVQVDKVDDGTGEMTVVGTTAARRARGRASGSRAVSAIWRCSAASRSACTSNRRISISSSGDAAGPDLSRDANDDSGHVVVRRRVAAPLRNGFEDGSTIPRAG